MDNYTPEQVYDLEDLHYLFSFTEDEKTYLRRLMKRDGVGLNGFLNNLFREWLINLKKEGAELSRFCADFEYSEQKGGFVDTVCDDYIIVRMNSDGKWEVAVWVDEMSSENRPPFYLSQPYDELWDAYKAVYFRMGSFRDDAQYPVPRHNE